MKHGATIRPGDEFNRDDEMYYTKSGTGHTTRYEGRDGLRGGHLPIGVTKATDPLKPALAHQEGGGHYKDMKIQPVEFIHANGIPYMEGNAIKYLCRWRAKNGIEDLKKARHYIDLLIEMESKDAP